MFGLDPAPGMLLVPLFCFFTSLIFSAFGIAVAASVAKIDQFNYVTTLIITPLFLVAGTFFPINQLPEGVQVASQLNPLHHLVELVRARCFGFKAHRPAAGGVPDRRRPRDVARRGEPHGEAADRLERELGAESRLGRAAVDLRGHRHVLERDARAARRRAARPGARRRGRARRTARPGRPGSRRSSPAPRSGGTGARRRRRTAPRPRTRPRTARRRSRSRRPRWRRRRCSRPKRPLRVAHDRGGGDHEIGRAVRDILRSDRLHGRDPRVEVRVRGGQRLRALGVAVEQRHAREPGEDLLRQLEVRVALAAAAR